MIEAPGCVDKISALPNLMVRILFSRSREYEDHSGSFEEKIQEVTAERSPFSVKSQMLQLATRGQMLVGKPISSATVFQEVVRPPVGGDG